jgi:hypothetical protein
MMSDIHNTPGLQTAKLVLFSNINDLQTEILRIKQ